MQTQASCRQNGITASVRTRHPVKESRDWQAAKLAGGEQGLASARRVVDRLWRPQLSAAVAERVRGSLGTLGTDGVSNLCFVTVPSTTGRNLLPVALAERLQADLLQAALQKGRIVVGERIAWSLDLLPMKEVPLTDRPFTPRSYVLRPDWSLEPGMPLSWWRTSCPPAPRQRPLRIAFWRTISLY